MKCSLSSQYLKTAEHVNIFTEGLNRKELVALVEGALLGAYAWKKYVKKDPKNPEKDKTVHMAGDAKLLEIGEGTSEIHRGIIARGIGLEVA